MITIIIIIITTTTTTTMRGTKRRKIVSKLKGRLTAKPEVFLLSRRTPRELLTPAVKKIVRLYYVFVTAIKNKKNSPIHPETTSTRENHNGFTLLPAMLRLLRDVATCIIAASDI